MKEQDHVQERAGTIRGGCEGTGKSQREAEQVHKKECECVREMARKR